MENKSGDGRTSPFGNGNGATSAVGASNGGNDFTRNPGGNDPRTGGNDFTRNPGGTAPRSGGGSNVLQSRAQQMGTLPGRNPASVPIGGTTPAAAPGAAHAAETASSNRKPYKLGGPQYDADADAPRDSLEGDVEASGVGVEGDIGKAGFGY